jgi:glycosyltransferase involved in cell wall biosynthesis
MKSSVNHFLSVIIPSYNRADALPETLVSLAHQSLPPDNFEVIVVDDGSTDGSLELIRSLQTQLPFYVKLVEQEGRGGPGAARNRGATAARYDLLLFWDSDMVADRQALQVHAELHAEYQSALVAGARRAWTAACQSTFARAIHLDNEDHFHGKSPSFWEVLSCNLSVQRGDYSRLGGFDESLWAFEDIDLAYRAQQGGLSLIFSREAIGYHNHPMTLDQACRHESHYQQHAAFFLRKHPELEGQIRYLVDKGPIRLDTDPPGLILRKLIRQSIASRGVLAALKACVTVLERSYSNPKVLGFLYWKILASYQLIGYREGLKGYIKEAIS